MEQSGIQSKLSGIERELVLQYLIDGNVPVTLTPIDETESEEVIKSLTSQIFPVAIKGEHIKVQKDGEILLENPAQAVINFANKNVKVEFYFNRVGLYFISPVIETKNGLSLSIPDEINRILDVVEEKNYDFSADIYFECKTRKDIDVRCVPCEGIELFKRPVWKIIPLEKQKLAKELLEKFVEQAKREKNAGNGIQLIPVCKYLTQDYKPSLQAMQDRKNDLNINSSYIATFSSSLEVYNSSLNKNVYVPSDGYISGYSFWGERNDAVVYKKVTE